MSAVHRSHLGHFDTHCRMRSNVSFEVSAAIPRVHVQKHGGGEAPRDRLDNLLSHGDDNSVRGARITRSS